MPSTFEPDEEPTKPKTKQYTAARVIQLWNAAKKKDQEFALRFLELAARDNQGEIKW